MNWQGDITIDQISAENFTRVKHDLDWILNQPPSHPQANYTSITIRPLNRGAIIKYELTDKQVTSDANKKTMGIRIYHSQNNTVSLTSSDKFYF